MKYNYQAIQAYIDKNHSWREVMEHFGISNGALAKANKKGWITFPEKNESLRSRISLGITTGRKHTEESKQKISEAMKQRHADGVAWNIGQSRWNNEPSWPEKFFTMVIENEFTDKNYITEYPMGKYSLDFAWPHLKKCIEIDGEQHQRFEEYRLRDEAKDKLLAEEGWEILRVEWKAMYNDSKFWINKTKDFIDV